MHRLKLDILHGWGSNCSQGLNESVKIINFEDGSDRLLYPIGKYLALKNEETTETDFI